MAEPDAIERLTSRHDREQRGHGGAATGAILFDLTRQPQPRAEWLDPGHWGTRAQPVQAGGRGGAWFVDTPCGPAVLRHYLRGGVAARLSRDRYLWQGESRVRSFAEYRLTEFLLQQKLPVPRPIAAGYERSGSLYRAAILLERLPGVSTLAQRIGAQGVDAPWEEAGRLVALFHRAGLDHADLNAHNILFDTAGRGWLIDFDRSRMRKPGATWRGNNLARLLRSLQKLRGARSRDEVEADFSRLRRAYEAGMEPGA